MSGTGFRVASRRIQAEKSAKHIGVARIKLNMLEFPNSRSLDPKNVQRLKNLFRGQRGCKPGDLQNRIPAVVDEATLGEALNASGLTRVALLSPGLDYPRLDLPPVVRLECLRGQHRVQAAKETSGSADTYWVIDLFIAGL
ncbi:hypothetical protein BDV41DRAFT_145517 [Aspergillus transmontanensis]|uniref:Uncharacterized protein n=1 Tax=Aspergillus transmontanensis TaxID=1034304 RepID=A0A5N6W5B6_9EURO|nr:hypothetical protein BDV41DRAFT_145517 [Aspergillus transmontanensis]